MALFDLHSINKKQQSMTMWAKSAAIALLATAELSSGFTVQKDLVGTPTTSLYSTVPDFNAVEVAKTGGQGVVSASQKAVDQDLSLGAPRGRPNGGHFMTKGGIQVTANVQGLQFSKSNQPGTSEAAIDHLIDQLDSHKGVLLTSSYEFPGRYARWSLGFVDPPLEVSGRADKCTIKALNERGRVLMPAIEQAMKTLKQQKILSDLQSYQHANGESGGVTQIDVTVVPPPEVGTFSEEERSRQVRSLCDAEQV
jgi:anthranilate synthase